MVYAGSYVRGRLSDARDVSSSSRRVVRYFFFPSSTREQIVVTLIVTRTCHCQSDKISPFCFSLQLAIHGDNSRNFDPFLNSYLKARFVEARDVFPGARQLRKSSEKVEQIRQPSTTSTYRMRHLNDTIVAWHEFTGLYTYLSRFSIATLASKQSVEFVGGRRCWSISPFNTFNILSLGIFQNSFIIYRLILSPANSKQCRRSQHCGSRFRFHSAYTHTHKMATKRICAYPYSLTRYFLSGSILCPRSIKS